MKGEIYEPEDFNAQDDEVMPDYLQDHVLFHKQEIVDEYVLEETFSNHVMLNLTIDQLNDIKQELLASQDAFESCCHRLPDEHDRYELMELCCERDSLLSAT